MPQSLLTNPEVYYKSQDPQDPRLGNFVQGYTTTDISRLSTEKFGMGILGYADHEGIELNNGRKGAAEGPLQFRKHFYKLTPSLDYFRKRESQNFTELPNPLVYDFGNIPQDLGSLKEKHLLAQKSVEQLYASGIFPLTIGGGHDYGFPDAAAFVQFALKNGKEPLVVNFDAHLDMRPNTKFNHSGTPFYRLLTEFAKDVVFFEFGLQDWCNSFEHFKWAKGHNAHLITLNDWASSQKSLSQFVISTLDSFLKPNTWLLISLDVDVFSSAYVPAASQAFSQGFTPAEFGDLWQHLSRLKQLKGVGIYELSPPFDHDFQSAKFVASLAHTLLFSQLESQT